MGLNERVKALWLVLVVFVASILTVAGVLALVTQTARPDDLLWLGILALTVFVYGPVFLGSLVVFWDARRSVEARRYVAVAFRIVLVLEALAAVAIVVYAMLEGAAVWLPVAFIATGAALTAVVVVLGPKVGEHRAARAPEPAVWSPVPRAEVVRKVRAAAISFVGTFVVVSVVLIVVLPGDAADALRLSAQLALFVAAMVFIGYSVALSRRFRDITGGDLGLATTVARVVLRGKAADLDREGRVAAAKYATLMPAVLGFQAAYLGLLWVGLAIQSLGFIRMGMSPAVTVPMLVAFVLVIGVVMPLMVVRIRRASRYAREHADLLPAGG